MERKFWHDKWHNNEIGFHQEEANPHLMRYWHELNAVPGAQVFVPMCGKSRDMLWLRDQGHSVLGVELSEMAIEAFFAEHNLPVTVTEADDLRCYQAENITLYCGDFFALSAEHLKGVRAVYDRGSLIALPPAMRVRYVRHLLDRLEDVRMLLVTLEYNQAAMAGPPFSVTEDDVKRYYGNRFSIRLLQVDEVLEANPMFIEKGLDGLQEKSYALS